MKPVPPGREIGYWEASEDDQKRRAGTNKDKFAGKAALRKAAIDRPHARATRAGGFGTGPRRVLPLAAVNLFPVLREGRVVSTRGERKLNEYRIYANDTRLCAPFPLSSRCTCIVALISERRLGNRNRSYIALHIREINIFKNELTADLSRWRLS